jgi:hypothetical protein
VYVLPLARIIDSYKVQRHGFADDSQLYNTFSLKQLPGSMASAIDQMEKCAASVRQWMSSNKLKLNDDKSELLLIAPRRYQSQISAAEPTLKIGEAAITPSPCARNLGGNFDTTMSMEDQVNATLRSIYYHLRRVAKIRCHLDTETTACVINSLVTSRLDFNNGLLTALPTTSINRLQRAQNSAARLLTRTKKYDHITPTLRKLHWLPVNKRILFKVLTLVYQALHDPNTPVYLRDMLPLYVPGRSLRSESSYLNLSVQRTYTTYGDRAFNVQGAKAWNKLPEDIRKQPTLSAFKRKLKTHLF